MRRVSANRSANTEHGHHPVMATGIATLSPGLGDGHGGRLGPSFPIATGLAVLGAISSRSSAARNPPALNPGSSRLTAGGPPSGRGSDRGPQARPPLNPRVQELRNPLIGSSD